MEAPGQVTSPQEEHVSGEDNLVPVVADLQGSKPAQLDHDQTKPPRGDEEQAPEPDKLVTAVAQDNLCPHENFYGIPKVDESPELMEPPARDLETGHDLDDANKAARDDDFIDDVCSPLTPQYFPLTQISTFFVPKNDAVPDVDDVDEPNDTEHDLSHFGGNDFINEGDLLDMELSPIVSKLPVKECGNGLSCDLNEEVVNVNDEAEVSNDVGDVSFFETSDDNIVVAGCDEVPDRDFASSNPTKDEAGRNESMPEVATPGDGKGSDTG